MDYKRKFWPRFFSHGISMPIIWLPFPIIIILDILIEFYHQTCFPLYGIEKVKRRDYIQIIDRNKLSYLNPLEKLGCMYCGYVNGFIAYFQEIAARTEKYWCGIMHENKPGFNFQPHQRKQNFSKFKDEEDFKKKYL